MDLRKEKTLKAVKNAFIELRSKKPLEKITVKELSEKAEISKATFYLHYRDIYDLSETLQRDVIKDILNNIGNPESCLTDISKFTEELFQAFISQQNLIGILFSGSQAAILPHYIKKELYGYICKLVPEDKITHKFNIILSYRIYGEFFAFKEYYKQYDTKELLDVLKEMG